MVSVTQKNSKRRREQEIFFHSYRHHVKNKGLKERFMLLDQELYRFTFEVHSKRTASSSCKERKETIKTAQKLQSKENLRLIFL
jgi:hypothetical protein